MIGFIGVPVLLGSIVGFLVYLCVPSVLLLDTYESVRSSLFFAFFSLGLFVLHVNIFLLIEAKRDAYHALFRDFDHVGVMTSISLLLCAVAQVTIVVINDRWGPSVAIGGVITSFSLAVVWLLRLRRNLFDWLLSIETESQAVIDKFEKGDQPLV